MELENQVAIVTGAARGIGEAIALRFAREGADIAVVDIDPRTATATADAVRELGRRAFVRTTDVSDPDDVALAVAEIVGELGKIDVLVNNAGANWAAPAEDYPDDGWHKVMGLNVDAAFFLAREVGRRAMIPRKSGKIVNIASIAGLFGNPPPWHMKTVAYNTSKGALVNLTRALAAEWGPYNINVNAICPGFFVSKMSQVTLERIEPSVLRLTPLGRLGGDEDLKGSVVFLASEASRHVTGQALAVDGGYTAI